MEAIFTFICDHKEYAYLIIFISILLSGLCIPISEDVMLLISGAIAGTCIPEHALWLYFWVFLACWFSAWEAYWIGRLLGPRLFRIAWFNRFLSPQRLRKLKNYYERFGIFTFLVGRFIPGGVRNAIFLTSGITEIPFLGFVVKDGIACLIATITIYSVGYFAGEHLHALLAGARAYEGVVLMLILFIFAGAGLRLYFSKSNVNP